MAAKTRSSEPVRRTPPDAGAGRLIDDRARKDIIGIAFILFGILLLLAVLIPTDALVTASVAAAMRLTFGIAAFIAPFFFVAIGLTFLISFKRQRMSSRTAVGLALILAAIMGLIALSTPVAGQDYNQLFYELALVNHGGYIGAAIAWSGLSMFGEAITIVLLIGIIVIGIIVIGFSISELIERTRAFARAHRGSFSLHRSGDLEAPRAARIRRAPVRRSAKEPVDEDLAEVDTVLLPDGVESAVTQKLSDVEATTETAVLPEVAVSSSADTALLSDLAAPQKKPKRRKASDKTPTQAMDAPFEVASADAGETESEPVEVIAVQETSDDADATETLPALDGDEAAFTLPPMSLLAKSKTQAKAGESDSDLAETAQLLQETLGDFGIGAAVKGWVAGPTVTLFKVELPAGVRVSRVVSLNDDIALALAAPGVRVFAPIPGTNYVGIEVPNRRRQTVLLGDVLSDASDGPLQIAIGKNVEGVSIVSDLAKMPHLLIGGTTGSGKSVSINAMIMSILMRSTPDEVRFVLIDPKRVEFTPYNGIPHLYVPVVTEAKEASSALAWGVAEMERRLKVMSKTGARNIVEYNAKVKNGELEDAEELCYIVIVIDELADLMMNARKEVEHSISRIAQLARAAGIHLIVATQRPSSDVVTGLIKANITNRIAFNVATGIDSRVILDTAGAESLIGLGDLLFSKPEYAKPQRIQGCYVSEKEISAVVNHLKSQGEPEYHNEILKTNMMTLGDTLPEGGGPSGEEDPLLWEAAEIVVASKLGSISNIQRRLKVGHSRAGRIMDQLEEKGIVGPASGAKARDVLVDELELETLKAFEAADEDEL